MGKLRARETPPLPPPLPSIETCKSEESVAAGSSLVGSHSKMCVCVCGSPWQKLQRAMVIDCLNGGKRRETHTDDMYDAQGIPYSTEYGSTLMILFENGSRVFKRETKVADPTWERGGRNRRLNRPDACLFSHFTALVRNTSQQE
ncbi:hypothetical protein IF2G_04734 [Cordyceps javanica]|nr:hypothetical protein IF2G_04734 [Cordyceps javanica]